MQTPTFEIAAKACHKARASGWEKKHADAFLSTLERYVFPKVGRLLVDSVDEREMVSVLLPLWHEKPTTARKIRQRISTVLDFAKGSGWRSSGAPRETLRPLLARQAKAGNFSAMAYEDVPVFITKLRSKPVTAGRMALLFTILTAARSGEVRSARWSHIDMDAGTWTRPAALMKTREPHVVTLSPAAIAILQKAFALKPDLRDDAAVFPSQKGGPLSDMTLLKIVKEEAGDYTVHGFRSAFRTWAAEQMPLIPEAVAEAALAHVVPDAVVRAYQRAKFVAMRRELLNAWGTYVEGKSVGASS